MVQAVSDEEVKSLTNSILIRYGIDFTCYELGSFRRRIIRILNHFDLPGVSDLWTMFLRDRDFIHIFMNEISVGMTSMFRDPILWRHLKKRLSQEYQTKNTITVWHAGCSTGEEVYSFGILLKESNLLKKSKGLATDFNKNAIEEAKSGEYHKIKMIQNESNYKEFNPTDDFKKYYTPNAKTATMHAELAEHVNFGYHNLTSENFIGKFDLIFCRNVMIYFDTLAKRKMIDKFYHSLNPGGYFIVGFFDTISHLLDNSRFRMVDEDAKILQRIA